MKPKSNFNIQYEIETSQASKLISYSAFVKNPELISQSFDEVIGVIRNDKILFYIHPSRNLKQSKESQIHLETFGNLIEEFYEIKKHDWSERHYSEKLRRYQRDLKPMFRNKLINQISIDDVINFLKKYQQRGVIDISHRLLSDISQVFDFAIITNKIETNFCSKIRKALIQKKVKGHACIDENELPGLLNSICTYQNERSEIIKYALKFISLTFVRVNELLKAEWSEFDLKENIWTIPADRMKMKKEHRVPLSVQALELLEQIKAYTNNHKYVFPHYFYNKPLKSNRLIYALYNLGYKEKMTVHGFRALASSTLNNNGFNPDAIEKQLAHEEANRVRRAYNRADYFETRVEMMQWWSDYLVERCNQYIENKQLVLI